MCSTATVKPIKQNKSSEEAMEQHEVDAKNRLRDGTFYGSLSLALLVLSFSVVMPHMQSRRDALECDSMCYGSMTSARSTLQLLGSALMGRWSDSSRKLCLVVGTVASLAGLVIAVCTFSIEGMYWSMIPGSLFQQNFNVLKALLSDYQNEITISEDSRAGSVGVLGMSMGLAFMAGPLVGATLLNTFEQATVIGIVATILSGVLVLKIPNVKQSKEPSTSKSSSIWSFLNVPAAKSPAAIYLMTLRIAMALAFHIFSTIWTVSLKERFDFGPSDHGKFMSFIGLTYALSQGLVAKRLLSRVTTDKGRVQILLVCSVLLGFGRYIAFQTTSLVAVYAMFAGIVTALGVVNTILTADTSRMASSSEIGGLIGILAAVESAAGMMGPILGGALALVHPIAAPLHAVVGLYVLVFLMVLFGYERFILSKQTDGQKQPQKTL